MKKIITSFIYPPIPIRKYDWQAFYDGEEELKHYGYGVTEAAAIAELQYEYPDETDDTEELP